MDFGYPSSCAVCLETLHIHDSRGIRGYLIKPELKARPYVGSHPSVLLIGQDPTLRTRQVYTALEFDQRVSTLRQWIEEEILMPIGFTVDDVYATNLVKCTFPTLTPSQWAKVKGIPAENLLYPFFRRCRKYLTTELTSMKPKIVIAFGQPTHRLLVSAYRWNKISPNMKEAFGQIFPVGRPVATLYVPVIRFNTRKHAYYRARWPAFLRELSAHL